MAEPAPPGRRTLLRFRLALYGTVALLGAAALWARAHPPADAESTAPRSTQLNGFTNEGGEAWVTVIEGRVRNVHIGFGPSRCTGRARWPGFWMTFRDTFDHFSRKGRAFAVGDTHRFATPDGWDAVGRVEVSGELSPDGRMAAGWAWTSGRFSRGRRAGESCDSGPHAWTATLS